MNEDRFIIDTMVWSYSRLSLFHQCPYGWYLKYFECTKGEPNFFGQFGSLMHKILEMYEKEELSLFEISAYYEENFDDYVTCEAPSNKFVDIRQMYYERGLAYLDNIDLVLDQYEILGIEKEVRFNIGGYEMVGYIDLLLRDKVTKEIIIVDHKSANVKFRKNGELSKSKKEMEHILGFKRQLYLYAIAVIAEYKQKPTQLWWNLFSNRKWLKIKFDDKEFEDAKSWAEQTVKAIEQETTWFPNPDRYYCWNICDMRNCACEYKPN